MKAQELRIGNWIRLKSKNKFYQIDSGHDIEKIYDAPENFDAVPIPLTEEWLIKFGFEKLSNIDFNEFTKKVYGKSIIKGNELHEEKVMIILPFNVCEIGVYNPNKDESSYLMDRNIECVHELQNLYFALTGEELLIK